jgi:hypothetical protein
VRNLFLAVGHSDKHHSPKCHKGFSKHDTDIFSVLILCVTKGSAGHEWPTGHRMHTSALESCKAGP